MNRTLLGYRYLMDMTQTEMGEIIGRSKSSYCKREIGKSEFKQSEMIKILAKVNEKFPLMTMLELFTKE